MILLSAEKISMHFPDKKLFDKASLYLDDSDKIGIVGVNGTGKTTLLNILAGQLLPDEGAVSKASGARIAYLRQNPIFDKELPLLSIVLENVDESARDESAHEAKVILTKLGIRDFAANTATMSEGEKKRVAIAQTLMSPCELLILDEPTNHLDSHMVQWLEDFLMRCRSAIVMVTHDRYFLERVTSRIIEISEGALYAYGGNYSQFLESKAQREEMERATQRKNRSIYKRELEWMRQGPKGRGTKRKDRIERFNALNDGVVAASEKMTVSAASSRLGKQIIEIDCVCKSYGTRNLVKDFSYILLRDARIGIVGRNGCGKTTLMKMIAGVLQPDSGTVTRGATVKIGYLSQIMEEPPADMRVIDYIRAEGGEIVTDEGVVSAAKMLERFLFPSDVQWTPVYKLSGGEKRRLLMLRVLMGAPNVLLLDEPTNDLDTDTLTVLEEYLESFAGAVVSISHDRYFLDKVMDAIIEFREDGEIRQYSGGYSDYLEKREPETDGFARTNKDTKIKAASPRVAPRPVKFSFSEQREYETIDADIAVLEAQLSQAIINVEHCASDYEKLMPALAEKERLESALGEKMNRWVYLNELAERIENARTEKS